MAYRDTLELSNKWGGRHAYDFDGKIDIRRDRIDREGYSVNSGQYMGAGGAPVWNVTDHETDGRLVDFTIRASDRQAAKTKIRAAYPGVSVARRRSGR